VKATAAKDREAIVHLPTELVLPATVAHCIVMTVLSVITSLNLGAEEMNAVESTRHYNPEDRTLHTHYCENLKSKMVISGLYFLKKTATNPST
jgi:hypothetical protein